MAENPLLPHRKLQELHALMLRARALTKAPAAAPRFEALLAATLMHVEPGDFVSPPPGPTAPAVLAAERTAAPAKKSKKAQAPAAPVLPTHQRIATVNGIAHGLKHAKSDRVAVYYTDAGAASAKTDAGWAEALAHAVRAELPLIFVCADATAGTRIADRNAISWASVSKLAPKLGLPILIVDGEDAVAVYRVMQESMIHARLGAGPAMIWAVMSPDGSKLTKSALPQSRLEGYLKTRGIAVR